MKIYSSVTSFIGIAEVKYRKGQFGGSERDHLCKKPNVPGGVVGGGAGHVESEENTGVGWHRDTHGN